jgi:hypothetical protein
VVELRFPNEATRTFSFNLADGATVPIIYTSRLDETLDPGTTTRKAP